ncbi:unnamed protein product [Staurois parvus]|uniref:Uncharacterized protein n=1 Tax=Staurois parvus TaxID=386267 RepID=A0ABN9EAK1_9NEOB|nr:unnamed protein product [Staurois parvus]
MPLEPFIGFFGVRTQGPHDPLLPEGPMSSGVDCPMRCPWYLFHRLF